MHDAAGRGACETTLADASNATGRLRRNCEPDWVRYKNSDTKGNSEKIVAGLTCAIFGGLRLVAKLAMSRRGQVRTPVAWWAAGSGRPSGRTGPP